MSGFIKFQRSWFYATPRLSPTETNILLFVADAFFTTRNVDCVTFTYEELAIGADVARRSLVTALTSLAERGFIHRERCGKYVKVQILHLENDSKVINLHLENDSKVQINHLEQPHSYKESKYKKKSHLNFKNSDYEPGGKYYHLVFNREQA